MKNFMYLDNLTRITRRREFEDGLFDFVLAVTFLMIGIAGWIFFSPWAIQWYVKFLILNREVTIIALLTLSAFFILLIFLARRFVEYIRRTYLWRESGYVKSLRWQVKRSINLIAGTVTILMIVFAFWLMLRGLISSEDVLRVLVSSVGVSTGIVFLGVGFDLQLRRYISVGLIGMMTSISLLFIPVTFSMSWLIFGLIWVTILSISGLVALRVALITKEERGNE
jgi:hypothetical protein